MVWLSNGLSQGVRLSWQARPLGEWLGAGPAKHRKGAATLDLALWILRGVFVAVAAGLGLSIINSPVLQELRDPWPWVVFIGILAGSGLVILFDVLLPRKRIELLSCIYFGIVVGLFLSYVLSLALSPLLLDADLKPSKYAPVVQVLMGVALCYICISFLLQTKDDFRFIIPYVEFSKEVKGNRPYILDTSVVIDGRLADIVETHIFDNQLIMPRFVIQELQSIADSNDRLRRARGRRGLDILNRLRNNEKVDFKIYDREVPGTENQPVDMKLVMLAKHLDGKIITGDYNLNKVARLHNVPVINLNDLANALKPAFIPGESLDIKLIKPGEEFGQGVGYLDDGTMVVIENGRDYVGKTVHATVTSVLQTSAGRMIFGKFERVAESA
ncbi:MAG: PIN/TRAM domain-containing protein [Pirellulaceae bacterium]|nr:MAG: PIN/TRAM domain-containing protein [Pirellulaceae bacterium]GIW95706.1 MAG: PIN/TRAM domain-containing protein [Pirellulaceae bacterium]